jgi:hypothetical protein
MQKKKAFDLNCLYSKLTALNLNRQHDNGKHRGERILNSISVRQEIKSDSKDLLVYRPAQ